ncbi:MAG: cation-translocating P-type ATPase [Myxococcota bacterium]
MERALHALGARSLRGTEHLHPDWSEERDYPLTRELLAVSHVWRSRPPRRIVAAKGSPETIADLCHLAPGPAAALAARAEALAVAGLRVLAVARAAVPEGVELPAGQHDFDFELVGLVAFEDPVRASVPAAVQAFADAGVRVVMITGDHVATARAIAGAAGIRVRRVVSGPELEAMDDATLSAAVGEVDVFARAVPDHKLRIVRALAARGEQVAMIGDGVNDAPALQAAHVGVALGHRGTDVAREAAALVMTTDDFGAVAHAIALGRRIDANLRRALGYLVAVHLPIAAMSLLPVLFGLSPMLLPVHVLFIELIIDPACSVALEAEAADPRAVRAPPRRPEDGLFPRSALLWSVVQGLVMLAVAAAAYFGALASGLGQDEARTLGFIVIVTGNAWLIQVSRSNERSALTMILTSRNRAALGILVAAFAVLALTLVVPPLAAIFHFGHLGGGPILLAFAAGSASALWFDAVKAVRARRVASTGAWSPT